MNHSRNLFINTPGIGFLFFPVSASTPPWVFPEIAAWDGLGGASPDTLHSPCGKDIMLVLLFLTGHNVREETVSTLFFTLNVLLHAWYISTW